MSTLMPFADRFVAERFARGEIGHLTLVNHRYRLHGLCRSFGDRPLSAFTRRAVEDWQATIGHLSPAARRAHLSTVRLFCAFLVERRLLRADPSAGVPPVREPARVPRALPAAAVSSLLGVLPDARARAIVWLMVGLGLRCVEVARLAVDDYDPVALTITVRGKGGHERILPVTPDAVRWALDAYLDQVGVISGPLIRCACFGRTHRGLSPNTISAFVSSWFSEAGIKVRQRDGRSAHALRHTAASDVLDQCGDLRIVQAMLGHRHLSSTSIYLRRADLGQLREAMSKRSYGPRPLRPVDAESA